MTLAKTFLIFFFPQKCVICAKNGSPICVSCLNQQPPAILRCLKCGRPNPLGRYCAICKTKWLPERVVAGFLYKGKIKDLVHQFKYEDATSYADTFGKVMANKAGNFIKINETKYYLVPIPLSAKRERERGYNQAKLLADKISVVSKIPLLHLLKRTEAGISQVQSGDKTSRRKNVKGVFFLEKETTAPEKIILIDDVITTGATVEEATKILRKAGVKEIMVLALAMT